MAALGCPICKKPFVEKQMGSCEQCGVHRTFRCGQCGKWYDEDKAISIVNTLIKKGALLTSDDI